MRYPHFGQDAYSPRTSDFGTVDEKFIKKDKEAYFSRWPVSHDEIVGEMSAHAHVPNERWSVAFRTNFRRESPERGEWVQGQVDSYFVIGRTDGGLKIFTENGHVLDRQKGTMASAKPAPAARADQPAPKSAPVVPATSAGASDSEAKWKRALNQAWSKLTPNNVRN